MRFNHRHYVPVVRWKRGEQIALRQLREEEKHAMTPLIELAPTDLAGDDAEAAKFTSKAIMGIQRNWGSYRAFLELGRVGSRFDQGHESEIASVIFGAAREARLVLVPVVRVPGGSLPHEALRRAVSISEGRACLRIKSAELPRQALHASINACLTVLDLTPSDVDLVLDIGLVGPSNVAMRNFSPGSLWEYDWRTLSIVGGSFPKDLTGYSVGQHEITRLEWVRWRLEAPELFRRHGRIPTFGDYMTLHPEFCEPRPGMNPSASIRYTSEDSWVVMRGEGLQNENGLGNRQYYGNADLLCERKEYCGSTFSFGDNYIWKVASRNVESPGSPGTWLSATVNHHITFVTHQIPRILDSLHIDS